MAHSTLSMDNRLFLPSLQAPEADPLALKLRAAELERLYNAALEKNEMLTAERDELVAAIKKWAKADHIERRELLFDAETQDLRTELKQARQLAKRLQRENNELAAKASEKVAQQQRRA